MKRWLQEVWWRFRGLCPNCGEQLIRCEASEFVDCYGCGYWRHELPGGFEHFPRAQL